MTLSRREFLRSTTYAGAALAARGTALPLDAVSTRQPVRLEQYATGMRMAATPATKYRAYRSKAVSDAGTRTWVQIDLGQSVAMDAVRLFPASERMYPGRDQYYAGEGFPLRFAIEVAEDEAFAHPATIAEFADADFPDPTDAITQYGAGGARGRYVRVTATQLRPVKRSPAHNTPGSTEPVDSAEYTFTLAKIAVLAGGKDAAVGCAVQVDPEHGSAELAQQLTRAYRQDGEEIRRDNPEAVTSAANWTPPPLRARAPKAGVKLDGGIFQTAMENNIAYLMNSYTTADLLRQFYERAGRIANFYPVGSQKFWEEDLAGSNAGRFLMGAGNTLRWMEDAELRKRLNAVVAGIEECRQPNGYIMAYPEDTIFYSERAAYTRAWLTHGLLEAAHAGNAQALPLLRGYSDWFNVQGFLPEMLRGAIQGGQGMVANTRVALSAVGRPADVQVIQQYYQEDAWLQGLARREREQIWQYPYDRPHCYLLTNLEAYLDLYLLTGETLYHDAVLGAWELYRAHWEQAGGSISIIEFEENPPDSESLRQKLGELCGSSFWVFLSQRFQMLQPDDERFATEIEKSIYNVALANQDGGSGLRYHTMLEGKKEKSTHMNSCCEGQGTRLIGSLPEHIYSVAEDGIYMNLFEPSRIEWQQQGVTLGLAQKTSFPLGNAVRCTLTASAPVRSRIRVRVPSWSAGAMDVMVNGQSAGGGEPGTFVTLEREWKNGDSIEFALQPAMRVTRYTGADQIAGKERYSIEYGPLLMAVAGTSEAHLAVEHGSEAADVARQFTPVEGKPLHFTMRGQDGLTLMPYWQIAEEEFTCFPTVG